ncbi:sn-1-specific diacylglycerol lipase ABHD11-like isoform X2 [Parasteatoda tepidariorum]|uniref:sn-1-specific diacylglycerol lipase ABHD11-like isoform X2 n=1 Tax=Parasteatoda tepidariorum TaxID=114398 RepID=UPI00077FA92F|nr:protein ABHD11-like isoform X2 [Parasteatoda tepidariorum]
MARYQPVKLAHCVFEAIGGCDKRKPPVIFMHSMLCSKEVWDPIPQRVAELTKRKVFTYDARNHGESEITKDSSFHNNLQDLYTFMDRMDIKDSVLVGHSFGGSTAISAALQEPKKVEKAFIVDMYVKNIPRELIDRSLTIMNIWTEVIRNLPKDILEVDIRRTMLQLLVEKLPEEMKLQSEHRPYLTIMYKRKPDGGHDVLFNAEALADALKQYQDSPIVHSGQYDGPAYFLYGSPSPFNVSSEEADIKKHFPKAEMIEFKGCKHHLFLDFPDKFVDTLVKRIE